MPETRVLRNMVVLLPDFDKRGGLLPTVVQDEAHMQVLMVGYSNEQSYFEMLRTGQLVLWSTSRNELWHKGKTSGDFFEVVGVYLDCDMDAILVIVKPLGKAACHTGARSCFFYNALVPGKPALPVPDSKFVHANRTTAADVMISPA